MFRGPPNWDYTKAIWYTLLAILLVLTVRLVMALQGFPVW